YGPQNDVTLKMPAFEWVHVQLHQQKGMISLSPPTICNSAPQTTPFFFCIQKKKPARRAGMKDNRTVSVEINDVTHFPGGYTNHPGQYRRYRNQRMRAVQCSFC
ncbi:hypothetical protein, partial [Escherichia coli]